MITRRIGIKNTVKGGKGFSLFEMLIVLALISILTAIAIPSFTGKTLPRMKLKRTAMDLYATLQLCRSRAIGSNAQYGLQFDLSSSPPKYKVMTRPDSTSAWAADATVGERQLEAGIGVSSVIVDATSYTTGTAAVIGFASIGTASSAEIRLWRTDLTTDRYSVTVSSSTGKVTINNTW